MARGPRARGSSRRAAAPWFESSGLAALVVTLGAACSVDGRTLGVVQDGGAGESAGGAAGSGGSSSGSGGLAGNGGASMSTVDGRGGLPGTGGLPGAGGDGGPGGSGGAGPEPDGGVGGDPGPQPPPCAALTLPGLGTADATTTASGEGQFTLSCAPGSSDDVGVFWVAPEAGYYSIDTFGSSFDTALGVVGADCTTELACNDDTGGITSEVVREFAAGEAVVFVVDGKSGSSGGVVLNAQAVRCPAIDLNRQQPPVATTTLDGTNEHAGACGGAAQLEKAFRWTAERAGLYRFTATSTEFSPALHLQRGPRCGGEPIGCNVGGSRSPATVLARVGAGEAVTLIVDGVDGAGSVELDVEDVSATTCPNQPSFGPFGEVSGVLTAGDPSLLTGSCVPARQAILPLGEFDLPEHSYPVSIGGALCDVLIEADGPVAVYVHEGRECGGRELVCQVLEDPSAEEGFVQADLGNLTGPAVDYVVTVEAANPVGGSVNYTLSFICAVI